MFLFVYFEKEINNAFGARDTRRDEYNSIGAIFKLNIFKLRNQVKQLIQL